MKKTILIFGMLSFLVSLNANEIKTNTQQEETIKEVKNDKPIEKKEVVEVLNEVHFDIFSEEEELKKYTQIENVGFINYGNKNVFFLGNASENHPSVFVKTNWEVPIPSFQYYKFELIFGGYYTTKKTSIELSDGYSSIFKLYTNNRKHSGSNYHNVFTSKEFKSKDMIFVKGDKSNRLVIIKTKNGIKFSVNGKEVKNKIDSSKLLESIKINGLGINDFSVIELDSEGEPVGIVKKDEKVFEISSSSNIDEISKYFSIDIKTINKTKLNKVIANKYTNKNDYRKSQLLEFRKRIENFKSFKLELDFYSYSSNSRTISLLGKNGTSFGFYSDRKTLGAYKMVKKINIGENKLNKLIITNSNENGFVIKYNNVEFDNTIDFNDELKYVFIKDILIYNLSIEEIKEKEEKKEKKKKKSFF